MDVNIGSYLNSDYDFVFSVGTFLKHGVSYMVNLTDHRPDYHVFHLIVNGFVNNSDNDFEVD